MVKPITDGGDNPPSKSSPAPAPAPRTAKSTTSTVRWVHPTGSSFLIPESYENNNAYLAGLFGFNSTQELTGVLQDEALNATFESFRTEWAKKFGKKSFSVDWDTLTGYLHDETARQYVIDARSPMLPRDCGETTFNDKVAYLSVLNHCHELIQAQPAHFELGTSDMCGPYRVDSWVIAYVTLRFYARRMSDNRKKNAQTIRNYAAQPPRLAETYAGPDAQGRPVTAVTDQPLEPGFTLTDFDPDELNADDGDENDLDPTDDTPLKTFERGYEQSYATMAQVSKGTRPSLTVSQRNHVVDRIFAGVRVLSDEGRDYTEFASTQFAAHGNLSADELLRADLDMGATADARFWEDQKVLNSLAVAHAPSAQDACDYFGIDRATGEYFSHQHTGDGTATIACRPKIWQVTGAYWLHRQETRPVRHSLLADDMGVGKTLTAGLHIVHDFQRARQGHIAAPYRPTLICCPSILVQNWFNELRKHFRLGIRCFIWHGHPREHASNPMMKSAVVGTGLHDLTKHLARLDPADPVTAVTVYVTSYQTCIKRALFANGKPAIGQTKELRLAAQRATAARAYPPDDDDDDAAADDDAAVVPDVEYTTPLTGYFRRVVADEAHKLKSTGTLTHRFVKIVKPNYYVFLTATPMSNLAGDLLGYLSYIWQDGWKDDESTVEQLFHIPTGSSIDEEGEEGAVTAVTEEPASAATPTSFTVIVPRLAHLDPDKFKSRLKEGNLDASDARRILPPIMEQIRLRRTFASEVEDFDGQVVLIGREIPKFRITTVELEMNRRQRRVHDPAYRTLIGALRLGGGGVTGDDGLDHGRMNFTIHKRLCQLTADLGLQKVFFSTRGKTNVSAVNHWYSRNDDHGMSLYHALTRGNDFEPVYGDRKGMALYLCSRSPKLGYLVHYVNEAVLHNERVLVFVEWPLVQWVVEGVLGMLNYEVRSVRSAFSTATRMTAVTDFNDRHKKVHVLVCSYKTAAYGLNIQEACHRVVHFEVPLNIANILQANGRVHRLGQKHEQDIRILTLDRSYDMILQHRLATKYLPQVAGSVAPPARRADGSPATDEYIENFHKAIIMNMLGQRCSRIGVETELTPYSFAHHQPPSGHDYDVNPLPPSPELEPTPKKLRRRQREPRHSKHVRSPPLTEADESTRVSGHSDENDNAIFPASTQYLSYHSPSVDDEEEMSGDNHLYSSASKTAQYEAEDEQRTEARFRQRREDIQAAEERRNEEKERKAAAKADKAAAKAEKKAGRENAARERAEKAAEAAEVRKTRAAAISAEQKRREASRERRVEEKEDQRRQTRAREEAEKAKIQQNWEERQEHEQAVQTMTRAKKRAHGGEEENEEENGYDGAGESGIPEEWRRAPRDKSTKQKPESGAGRRTNSRRLKKARE